ncbi:MAG: GNAT family N-acetyltransferase [Candidatus Bipolaricaulota bacterium]|nr:MAG: GNAT family N-acetyltransferase [Candidatus Bipolaricaulota bacterium]
MSGSVSIREMRPEDEYFVATCSHTYESEEIDSAAGRRRELFASLRRRGARFKVALLDGEPVGFAYGLPIEHASWGPLGDGLVAVPCLCVTDIATGRGLGRRLLEAIEDDARRKGRLGMTVIAYRGLYGAEWFMPATYFERLGFEVVVEKGSTVLLWKPFAASAVPPQLLEPEYTYQPIPGKVVIDLFWNGFCQTSAIEAQRVRDIAAEFEGKVVLNEYCAEDRDQLLCHQIPRAIFVNGVEIGWGYEAPREGIRRAIEQALAEANA